MRIWGRMVPILWSLASATACTPAPRDVILISVDTLRSDHLGLYGYDRDSSPRLDRFFADGAVFERAYSASASTPQSVATLLSGLLPQDHGVRLFFQQLELHVQLLPELLPKAFQSAAFVSNFVLTDDAMGLAHAFDHYDDFVDERESSRAVYERRAQRTTDAALAWLERQRDPQRPLFLWVHYIDPHGPYNPPAPFRRRFQHDEPVPLDPSRVREHLRLEGVSDARDYVDRYDGEIAYVDSEIGRLLDGYGASNALEEALVVFTADHGETLMDHDGWFRHGHQVYEELVRVPLAIRGPGIAPGRHSELVTGADVVPTVLAFVGVPIPETLPGLDLLGALAADRTVYAEASEPPEHWRAAIRGDRKWVLGFEFGDATVRERRFYDLADDGAEQRPIDWPTDEGVARSMLQLLARDPDAGGRPAHYRAGVNLRAPKVATRADGDDLERLRALGYVD